MIVNSEPTDNEILANNADNENKGSLHFTKIEMIDDLKTKFPELSKLSPIEAEENLIYGMNVHIFTEKAKIKPGTAYTIDEDTVTVLLPKSKKKTQIKIYMLKITDISRGKLSGNFIKVEKGSNLLNKIDEKNCLTIHCDNNFKYYNLIFESENKLQLFILGIIMFIQKAIIEEIKISNTDLLSLKKIWKEYDPNHNKYLNKEQFSKFLTNINFQWKKKRFDQIFKEIDSKKEGKIRFKDFISFYELIVTGEEFREVFQKYSSDPNKKYMSMRGLSEFMEKEQHTKLSSQKIFNLMIQFSKRTKKLTQLMKNNAGENKIDEDNNNINIDELDFDLNKESLMNIYENHSFGKNYYTDLNNNNDINLNQKNFKNAFTLNFREFVNLLLDKNIDGIYNQEYFSIHQNMNMPLYSYYIYSSHNTYLDGGQLNSKSTVEMYYCALKNGCRLLELDCWDGRNGVPEEPIITHWHFPVGEVNFREVLVVIRDYAFRKSEFPVVLSIENHCSAKAQMNMEKYFREVLQEENLYILNPEDPPLNYPSPNELKRKYIIKCKRKRIFGNFEKNIIKKSDVLGEQSEELKEKKINLNKININNNNLSHYFNDNESAGDKDKYDLNGIPFSPKMPNLAKENNTNSVDENFLNKKKQFIETENIIQEEELSSKIEDNFSEIDENAKSNNVYNFENKEKHFLMSPETQNNFPHNGINSSLKIIKMGISTPKKSDQIVNFNIQNNFTNNITNNNVSIIDKKGSLKNLTKTGSLNRSVNEKGDLKVVKGLHSPALDRDDNDHEDLIKQQSHNQTKIEEENQRFSTNMSNSNKKTKKLFRKKSNNSFESIENKETNEIQVIQATNSNYIMKKLRAKYSNDEVIQNNTLTNFNKENIMEGDLMNYNGNLDNIDVKAEIIRIQEIQFTDTLKLNKPHIKTIDQLATVVGMVGVKYKREDFENSQYLPWECISISEPDFEKYVQNVELKIKIIKFCQRGFLKIYPDTMRTNSSNHDPIQCWSAGVQVAALNLQKTEDDWVLLNKIFFKINGGSKSGYILKPDALLNPYCDDAIKMMFWKPICKIKFKILSGFHLHLCFPKGIKVNSIFVEVTLRSPRNPHDENIQQVVLTTDTISNNFLHPVWQSNSKQFEIYDPDLSFFVVKIFSSKRQQVLARSVIPVKILKLGYRVLDLYDNVCSKFDSSFLIVKTNKIFLN